MRALQLHGVKDAHIVDIAVPDLVTGSVRIGIEWAGICGTDLRLFTNGPGENEVHPLIGEPGPHGLGHEFSGVVTEIAGGVTTVAMGDPVAVRPNLWDGSCAACRRGDTNICAHWAFIGVNGGGGGFSDSVVVPEDAVYRLPKGIGTDVGALVESTTVGWHAAKRSGAAPGDTALIVGAGPIGLAVLLSLKARGVTTIIMSEPTPRRAELARSLGALIIDPREGDLQDSVRAIVADGVDVSFDAAGFSAETFTSAYDALRDGGHMVVVARVHEPIQFDVGNFLLSEKSVTGSFAYTDEDFAEVIEAIGDGRLDPSPLISSRISLEDISARGLEHLLGNGRATEIKILVSPTIPSEDETNRRKS